MAEKAADSKEIDEAIKNAAEKEAKKKEEQKKKSHKDEISELTDTLQRLQAEFENYKKRCDKDIAFARQYASAELVKKLLPTIDSFELALKNRDNKEEFAKGVELIFRQLYSTLEHEGLRKIDCCGKKCDPYLHDVMLTEKCGKEEGLVLEELQRGYMFRDRVLRHSKVKVAKNDTQKDKA